MPREEILHDISDGEKSANVMLGKKACSAPNIDDSLLLRFQNLLSNLVEKMII